MQGSVVSSGRSIQPSCQAVTPKRHEVTTSGEKPHPKSALPKILMLAHSVRLLALDTAILVCQGYRLQKQREMGECVAYAESLRGDDGRGPLTPRVAHDFREAVGENRRPPNEVENNNSSACNITTNRSRNRDDADGGFRKDHPSATDERSTSLKAALSAAVDRKIPESTRSAGDSDGSEDGSEDDGEDDHGDRSHASGDEGTSSGSDVGTGGSRQNDPQRGNASVSGGTRRGGRRREVSARVGAQRDDKGAKGEE